MRLTRERLLLAVGLASVLGAGLLLFAPGLLPLGPLEPLTDADTATQVGLVLGLIVVGLAAYQMRRTGRTTLDRSGLLSAPPEQARDGPVPTPGASVADTYRRVRARLDRSKRASWHVAAYGRRASETEPAGRDRQDPPPTVTPRPPERHPDRRVGPPRGRPPDDPGGRTRLERPSDPGAGDDGSQTPRGSALAARREPRAELLAFLDELAVTARDAYGTATGCDETAAARAVAAGNWTDDRVAAAFLATDDDAPTFTTRERALAWLAPRRALDRRLDRVLAAIERHADGYLTYRSPSVDGTAERAGGGER